MMAELFRITVIWSGMARSYRTLGAMSPVFYCSRIASGRSESLRPCAGHACTRTGFASGGVAQDLPQGWDRMVGEFTSYMRPRLDEYDRIAIGNRIFKARTQGIGRYNLEQAIEWGVTGPGLRACGFQWDFRKKRPYSGYDQFEFDIPIADAGDCYARGLVRVEEMRQSLRIIDQCRANMPAGLYKSEHTP